MPSSFPYCPSRRLGSVLTNRWSGCPPKAAGTLSSIALDAIEKKQIGLNTRKDTVALYFDPNDPNMESKIEALQPTKGYCLFIDIVGSTELKDQGIKRWASFIYNTFSNTLAFLSPFFFPLKSIGDALMFFISEERFRNSRETPLTLFSALCSIANERETYFKEVKIATAYCADAYEITFVKGTEDIYGKDIDLTTRLLSKAQSREIVMNEEFVNQVRSNYRDTGNKEQFPEVDKIFGPWPEKLKGFRNYVNI